MRIFCDSLEGEASEAAQIRAAFAWKIQSELRQGGCRVKLLFGGELTVMRRGTGVGGQNAAFCVALDIALDGAAAIEAVFWDTGGVDGAAAVAGAIFDPDTIKRA